MSFPFALARLVRLPSVLTVPGDVLVGSAWARRLDSDEPEALAVASSLLYLAGMALNDYADREVDAVERPSRPIPAQEVSPRVALGLAQTLTGAALAVAAGVGGRRALTIAVPLTATVWSYDLKIKETPLGPGAMALARTLDVLLGACAAPRRSLAPASLIGAHTLMTTLVSRREVAGATRALPTASLAVTAGITGSGIVKALRHRRDAGPGATVVALACQGLYAQAMGRAAATARRQPDAARLQRLVGTGVLALLPLQAALLAAAGRPRVASAILAGWPLAVRAARRAAVT